MPTTQRHGGVTAVRCGYTLAELVVVVLITIVVASLIYMYWSTPRGGGGQIASCTSNVDSIVTAMIEYTTENRQMFPTGSVKVDEVEYELSWHNLLGRDGLVDTVPPEGRILNKYINNHYLIAKCPRDVGDGTTRGPETAWDLYGSSYLWWDRTADQVQNNQLVGRNGVWAIEGHSEGEIVEPTKKCIIADLVILTDRKAKDRRNWWHNDEEPLEVSIGFADGHARNVQRKVGVGSGEWAEYDQATVIDTAKRDSWIATRYY